MPNIIEIDHYNSELCRFKVGAFFETQCSIVVLVALQPIVSTVLILGLYIVFGAVNFRINEPSYERDKFIIHVEFHITFLTCL